MCSRMQMLRIEKYKINRKIKFNYKRGNLSGRITFFTYSYSSTIFTYSFCCSAAIAINKQVCNCVENDNNKIYLLAEFVKIIDKIKLNPTLSSYLLH